MIGDLVRALRANQEAVRVNVGLTVWVARGTLAVGYCGDAATVQAVDYEHADPLLEVR